MTYSYALYKDKNKRISDLFIITSVIETGNHYWSYSKTRSVFSPNERFEQTLKTIESIRNLKDDSKILLIECSNINAEMTHTLKEKVDYFIQTFNIESIRKACLHSNKKGFGEAMATQYACKYISSQNIIFKRLFKISGRYFLNSEFDKSNYSFDKFSFRYDEKSKEGVTVLYSVPYSLFETYKKHLQRCIDYYQTQPPISLEWLLLQGLTPLQSVSILGVSGWIAIPNPDGTPVYYSS